MEHVNCNVCGKVLKREHGIFYSATALRYVKNVMINGFVHLLFRLK